MALLAEPMQGDTILIQPPPGGLGAAAARPGPGWIARRDAELTIAARAVVFQPARVRVIAVGRVRKRWVADGVALYQRRLPGLLITEVKDAGPLREAEAILAALRPDERLVALSEEGSPLSSTAFAAELSRRGGDRLAFVIGGADGLAATLRQRASWLLSLSAMTFPHDLARLLLLEQLHRADTILRGGPYHRA